MSLIISANLIKQNDIFLNESAYAETVPAGYVDIGDILLSNYETKTKKFNYENLKTLYTQISGNLNASFDTIETLAKNRLSSNNFRNNNKLLNGNVGKDIALTFGGLQWTATQLFLDNNNNVCLDLMLLDSTQESDYRYSTYTNSNDSTFGTYPSNMYGSSYIRAVGLNNGGTYATSTESYAGNAVQDVNNIFANFTMNEDEISTSVKKFIVKPIDTYQKDNTVLPLTLTSSGASYPWDYVSNETLETPVGYSISSTLTTYYYSRTAFSAWKDDSIWLPSYGELGRAGVNGSTLTNFTGRWELSATQYRTNNSYYIRSIIARSNGGSDEGSSRIRYFNNIGVSYNSITSSANFSVRPALHLNLSLAEENSSKLIPTKDIVVGYNSKTQKLDSIADWFDSSSMSVTYNGNCLDAGLHTASVTLTDEKCAFEGTESRTADIKIIINKKKIPVSFSIGNDGFVVITEKNSNDIYTDDLVEGRKPVFVAVYDSNDGAGYHFDETTTPTKPNKVGSYIVTAKIVNDCNYQIDTSSTYTTTFTKNKTIITRPNIQTKQLVYNGNEQEFPLMGGMNLTDIKVVPITAGLTYDSTTGVLKATKAGKYSVRIALADSTETKWNDGDNRSDPFELEIEITKKFLNLNISTDNKDADNNVSWAWKADQTPKVIITGDSFVGDRTELKIYYYNTNNSTIKYDDINNNKEFSDDYKTRTITMPKLEPGVYVIGIEIFGNNFTNDCYQIAGNLKTQSFTVLGSDITLEHPIWLCNGSEIEDRENIRFTYSGSSFNFTIDEEDLKNHGMEIDLSQGVNGFTGNTSVTDAGSYSITVYLKSLPNYEQKTATHIINYNIEKGKYDLSKLSWNYNETNKRYFIAGTEQSVILTGVLPSGLTARYSQNKGISVGNYNASVSFTNSITKNYITPDKNDTTSYLGNFVWSLSWQIEKAILSAEWDLGSGSSQGTVIPKLKPVGNISLHQMVNYVFYETDSNYDKISDTPISVNDIGNDSTKEQFYIVEAYLTDANAQNYILDPQVPTETFSTGSDKYVIQLKILINNEALKETYPYSDNLLNIDFEFTLNPSGIRKEDIVITYYKDEDTIGSTDIPNEVGSYHAVITIKDNPSSVVGGTCDTFDFEIVKADFDISNLKWLYTHKDVVATYDFSQSKWIDDNGHEITSIRFDGTEHLIELIGLDDSNNSLRANISATNSSGQIEVNSNGKLAFIDAGNNTLNVSFIYNSNCYNAPNFASTLPFNISKANIDTSKIVWGYVINNGSVETVYSGQPLEYARVATADGSTALSYTMKLINVPEELKECIKYSGNTTESKVSITSNYQVSYTIDYTLFNTKNFETCSMPAGLRTKLDWKISPIYLDIPVYDSSWTIFDDQIHNFATMCSLQEDWNLYYDMIITKDGNSYSGLDEIKFENEDDRNIKAYDAGKYVLKFTLKNSGADFYWKEKFQDITIDVGKIIINIDRWSKYGVTAEVITDYDDFGLYTEYIFKDAENNIIDVDDVIGAINADITKVLIVKNDYVDNVILNGESTHHFKTGEGGRTFVEKPTMPTNIEFTGEEIDIEQYLIEHAGEFGYKPSLMKIEGDMIATNAGTYKISIILNDMNSYRWEGEDADIDELEFTWTINKLKISGSWQEKDGYQIFVPTNSEDADKFSVVYLDKNGNKVSIENLVKGESYTAKVVLKDVDEANYEIVDANNVSIEDTKQFDFKDDSNFLTPALALLTEYWLYLVIALAVLIILILFIIFIKRRKKKKQEILKSQEDAKSDKLEKEKEELQKKLDEANAKSNSPYGQMPYPMPPPYYPPMPPQYPSYNDSNLSREIQELREQVKSLTKYNLASEEEKNQNSRLARVENMLMQFLMSNFANNPNWIPFNNQDMINYDIDDLMKIYMKAKQVVSNNYPQKNKQRIILNEEAQGFEDKVSEYNKQKTDSQYVELLNELRDRITKVEDKIEEEKKERVEDELEKTKQELAKSRAELEIKQNEVNNLKEENKQRENEKLLEDLVKKNGIQETKTTIEKPEFNEAFNNLSSLQKNYFNILREYALNQPQARVKANKFNLVIGIGNDPYIKFVIKRNVLFACFDTSEIKLEDDNAIKNAKHWIDVKVEEIKKSRNLK